MNNPYSTIAQISDEQVFVVNKRSLIRLVCVYSLAAATCATIIAWLFPHGIEEFGRINTRSGIIGFLLSVIVLVMCTYYLLCFLKFIILNFYRLPLMFEISDTGIKISNRSTCVLIKNRRLLHVIYNRNDEILLIIDIGTGVLTLSLEKYAFRKSVFQRLVQRLKLLETYTDNLEKKRKLYKEYRVDTLLRTNHLELRMNSLVLN